MTPNPLLRQLGLAPTDRALIIHVDDVGMCHASLAAFAELAEFGLISSGAVMVPCPWFPATAAYVRARPMVDLGVHLTLTSEWDTYRWAPISTTDPATGLIDDEGYFHRGVAAARAADPVAVQRELADQIDRALAAGIDVTHVDTHMGTVAHPALIPIYVQLAQRFGVPAMLLRQNEAALRASGLDRETARYAATVVQQLERDGMPLIDHLNGLALDDPRDRMELALHTFKQLPAGITHFTIHAAHDTPELRAIAPDWRCRVADYETFMRDDLRRAIHDLGIHIIGYRTIRDTLR